MRGQRRRLDVIRAATGGGSGPRALGCGSRSSLLRGCTLPGQAAGTGGRPAVLRSLPPGRSGLGAAVILERWVLGCVRAGMEKGGKEKGREKRDGKKKERGKGKGSYVERKTIRRMKGRGDKNERGMKKKKEIEKEKENM